MEIDEEITSVIDRLRKSKNEAIALVIPRGSNIAQSVVNLKILKKSAEGMGKLISLVSSDRVARNLASQVGVTVFAKPSEAKDAKPPITEEPQVEAKGLPKGFRVHSYYNSKDEEEEEEVLNTEEENSISADAEASVSASGSLDGDAPESAESVIQDEGKPDGKSQKENIKEETRGEKQFNSKVLETMPRKNFGKNKKIALAVIGIAIAAVLVLAYFFIPYANAFISLKTEEIKFSKEVTVDIEATDINQDGLTVPGKIMAIEKEASKTYQSTGKKAVGEMASGKITIYNEWDDKAQTIPAGSKFVSGGKTFVSKSEATVPGLTVVVLPGKISANPGTVDVIVSADTPGDSYNIGPSSFTIISLPSEKQGKIYGRSTVAMSGGTTKTTAFVTDLDLKNALADLLASVVDASKSELSTFAKGSDFRIFENNVASQILSEEANKKVDDEADSFDYKMRIKIYSLGFAEKSLKTLIINATSASLSADQMLVNPDKGEVSYELLNANAQDSLKLAATFVGQTGPKIGEEEIKNEIAGKKYYVAQDIIKKKQSVENIKLDIWPSSLFKVPIIKNRIKVKFDYQ